MSGHTPGPWHVVAGEYDSGTVVSAHGGIVIDDPNISDEDARLIAAAPELLEAAKSLIGDIEREQGRPSEWCVTREDGSDEEFDPLITVKFFKSLADAVAKAEGR